MTTQGEAQGTELLVSQGGRISQLAWAEEDVRRNGTKEARVPMQFLRDICADHATLQAALTQSEEVAETYRNWLDCRGFGGVLPRSEGFPVARCGEGALLCSHHALAQVQEENARLRDTLRALLEASTMIPMSDMVVRDGHDYGTCDQPSCTMMRKAQRTARALLVEAGAAP